MTSVRVQVECWSAVRAPREVMKRWGKRELSRSPVVKTHHERKGSRMNLPPHAPLLLTQILDFYFCILCFMKTCRCRLQAVRETSWGSGQSIISGSKMPVRPHRSKPSHEISPLYVCSQAAVGRVSKMER